MKNMRKSAAIRNMRSVQKDLRQGDAIDKQFTIILEDFCNDEIAETRSPDNKKKLGGLLIGTSPRSIAMEEYVA